MRKKIIIVFLLSLLVLCFILAGCAEEQLGKDQPYTMPPQSFKQVAHDETFTIDGALDESIYQQLIWFDESYKDIARVKLTAYIGDKGIFIATDVQDSGVYCNPLKGSFYNSGLELYIGAQDATSGELEIYQIDLNANGFYFATRWEHGAYRQYVGGPGYDNDYLFASTPVGGEVNTPECKGYVQELFLSYEYLNIDEKPDYININPSIIRANNATLSDKGRVWYNFGQEEKVGLNLGNPSTWFRFYETGYYAHKVSVDNGAEGVATVDNQYTYHGQNARITIAPNSGYAIKSVTRNNKDVTDRVCYDGNGKYYYDATVVEQDTQLKVTYQSIKDAQYNLSGSITLDGDSLLASDIADIQVEAISAGATYKATVAPDGSYTVSIPEKEFDIHIQNVRQNYSVYYKRGINLNDQGSFDIALTSKDLGFNRKVSMYNPVGLSQTGYHFLFSYYRQNVAMTNKACFKMTFAFDLPLFDENGQLDHEYIQSQMTGNFIALHSKFYLYQNIQTEDQAGNFISQLLYMNSKWVFRVWLSGQLKTEVDLTLDQLKALNGKGLDLSISMDGNNYKFYLGDGFGTDVLMYQTTFGDANLVCKYGDLHLEGVSGFNLTAYNNYVYADSSNF